MTLTLDSHTVLMDATIDTGDCPFGTVGVSLLPDGTFLASVVIQSAPTSLLRVWKLSSAGAILGTLTIDTGDATNVGRAHLRALDGFLVQALYMTGTLSGGKSYVLDARANTPSVVKTYADASGASAYGGWQQSSIYLKGPGVMILSHTNGITMYRRGKPMLSRNGAWGGDSAGIFPHPTDAYRCAFWSSAPYPNAFTAWEIHVTGPSTFTVTSMGLNAISDDNWTVGVSSPYASAPYRVYEDGYPSYATEVRNLGDTTVLWTDPLATSPATFSTNYETKSCSVGFLADRIIHFSEINFWDIGAVDWLHPTGPRFYCRLMVVDRTGGTANVQQVRLDYGLSHPDGYPYDWQYVGLFTGSGTVDERDGSIVAGMCVVSESGPSGNYYGVVVWKMTGGARQTLSGRDNGAWRRSINNGTERLHLNTSAGFYQEAGAALGIDKPSQPAYVKTSQRWEVLGRFCDVGAVDLPEPTGANFVDIPIILTDINADLATAQTTGGATYNGTYVWQHYGAFAAQGAPPAAADLADSNDATSTVLTQSTGSYNPVECFTARLLPIDTPPAGAEPYAFAVTVRGRALTNTGSNYHRVMITPSTATAPIRGLTGYYLWAMVLTLPDVMTTGNWGVRNTHTSDPLYAGSLVQPSTYTQTLEQAMAAATTPGAQWWETALADPGFYVVIQNPMNNTNAEQVEIAEIFFTMRYLVP